MIHDAKIEVTCDNDRCTSVEFYDVPYTYRDMGGGGGAYRSDDEKIEEWLTDECDWTCDDGKHFCCEGCQRAAKPKRSAKRKAAPSAALAPEAGER